MELGSRPLAARIALTLLGTLVLATGGCTFPGGAKTPVVPAAKPSGKPGAGPVARPAALPAGSFEATKLRVQKVRNFRFRDKATGKILDPRLAQSRREDEVALEPGDMDELLYDKGRLRYAFYGREITEQPYVVERDLEKPEYQAIEDGLDADGFWGIDRKSWDDKTRFPFYYVLYTVGDAGYEASFTPSLGRLKKAGPLFDAYIDQMGAAAKLPAGTKQIAFAQQALDGAVSVSVSTQTPDAAGDPLDKPFNLSAATVDYGKGKENALIGPTENAFTYVLPVAGGQFMNVSVELTTEDGKLYKTVLPIRSAERAITYRLAP